MIVSPLRSSFPEEKYSDSELSEDVSSVDALWTPEGLCQETNTTSAAESDARRLARRKLYMACTVSLVFMTGEVIGNSHTPDFGNSCHQFYFFRGKLMS